MKLYLKIGQIFKGGDYSENGGNRRRSEKLQTSKKRSSKIYGAVGKKSREGAANLGSALGGRHPSYATVSVLISWQAYRGDQIYRKNSPT